MHASLLNDASVLRALRYGETKAGRHTATFSSYFRDSVRTFLKPFGRAPRADDAAYLRVIALQRYGNTGSMKRPRRGIAGLAQQGSGAFRSRYYLPPACLAISSKTYCPTQGMGFFIADSQLVRSLQTL